MMRRPSLSCFLLAALVACPPMAAHAAVSVRLMQLTWDPGHPYDLPYQPVDASASLAQATSTAWSKVSPGITAAVLADITRADRFRKGVTLYDATLDLGTAAPSLDLLSGSAMAGRLRMTITGNALDFHATHPMTTRDTDGHFGVTFDIDVDVDFRLDGRFHPPIEIVSAVAHPVNVRIRMHNAAAVLGVYLSEVESALTSNDSLRSAIESGMNGSSIDVAGMLATNLRTYAGLLDVPPGYQYNGGQVDAASHAILVAAWRRANVPDQRLALRAHWDATQGRVLPNCEPLDVRFDMIYAPPTWGSSAPLHMEFRASTSPASYTSASEMACVQEIASWPGAHVDVKWKERLDEGNARTPGQARVIRATPVGWANTVRTTQAPSMTLDLALAVSEGMHDGSRQRDRAQEVLLRDPGAPVERSGSADRNPRVLPQAQARVSPGEATALNPQPLPPGTPDPESHARTPASGLARANAGVDARTAATARAATAVPGALPVRSASSTGGGSAAPGAATPPSPAARGEAMTSADIVEPAAGAALRQGQLRVRIANLKPGAGDAQDTAIVELTSLPPRATSPGTASPSTSVVRTWQVPVRQLLDGASVPRDVAAAFVGPTLVRVKPSGHAPWTGPVSFVVTSEAQAQARTGTPPDWGGAVRTAPPPSAATTLGHVPQGNAAGAVRAPASAFGQ